MAAKRKPKPTPPPPAATVNGQALFRVTQRATVNGRAVIAHG